MLQMMATGCPCGILCQKTLVAVESCFDILLKIGSQKWEKYNFLHFGQGVKNKTKLSFLIHLTFY